MGRFSGSQYKGAQALKRAERHTDAEVRADTFYGERLLSGKVSHANRFRDEQHRVEVGKMLAGHAARWRANGTRPSDSAERMLKEIYGEG